MKITLSITLLLAGTYAYAQTADRQVLASMGGSFSGSAISADYTAGEIATATTQVGSFTLTQGFQQGDIGASAIAKTTTVFASYQLYPNPAREKVFFEITLSDATPLKLSICNVNGQILWSEEHKQLQKGNSKIEINTSAFASGVYLLNVYKQQGDLAQSIRFNKL